MASYLVKPFAPYNQSILNISTYYSQMGIIKVAESREKLIKGKKDGKQQIRKTMLTQSHG